MIGTASEWQSWSAAPGSHPRMVPCLSAGRCHPHSLCDTTGRGGRGWDKRGQDGTRQDRTGWAGTGWDRMGLDGLGRAGPGQDGTGLDRPGQNGTGWDSTGGDRMGLDGTGTGLTLPLTRGLWGAPGGFTSGSDGPPQQECVWTSPGEGWCSVRGGHGCRGWLL